MTMPGDVEQPWEEEMIEIPARTWGNVNFFIGAVVGFLIGSAFTYLIMRGGF
jgi:hypothetical protein